MENLNNMTSSQLTAFVATFERNAFHWTDGATETAHLIEYALKEEDTTNAVPAVKPSTLTGHPLTTDEAKTVLYNDVRLIYRDIAARETINEGGTSIITPIIPDWLSEDELTEMWVEGYRKASGYEHMDDDERDAFDEEVGDFLENHSLYIVDLDSQLGSFLTIWDTLLDPFVYALTLQNGPDKYLIIPENGAKLESMLFSKPGEAARFWEIVKRRGLTVSIDNRVAPDDVDVNVLRAFTEVYASLHGIQLSDSVLDILARAAADNAELFALPLNTLRGSALEKMWGIPGNPSFADNLALYRMHHVIVMDGNIYRLRPESIQLLFD